MKFRKKDDVLVEIERLVALVWYFRCSNPMLFNGELDKLEPEHKAACLKARAQVEEMYAKDIEAYENAPEDLADFEWGMINGKLSALRWVLGDDWDMLDT